MKVLPGAWPWPSARMEKSSSPAAMTKPRALEWRTGLPIRSPVQHPKGITAVAFNSDGNQVATGSPDGTAQLWDAGTWKPLGVPLCQHGQINCVAFALGDALLVTAGADNSARLWFCRTSHPVGPGLAHRERVSAVALSPDGRTLATASDDKMAKLWAMPTLVTEVPEHLVGWVQALTGLELDENNSVRVLPADEWQARRDRFTPLPSLDHYADRSDVLAWLLAENADHPDVLAALLAENADRPDLLAASLARLAAGIQDKRVARAESAGRRPAARYSHENPAPFRGRGAGRDKVRLAGLSRQNRPARILGPCLRSLQARTAPGETAAPALSGPRLRSGRHQHGPGPRGIVRLCRRRGSLG